MNISTLYRHIFLTMMLSAFVSTNAFALDNPNANYSRLVLSYQNTKFSNPVCINNECHNGVGGPVAVFTQQLVPNFALGLSGSYLQSNGSASTLTSTGTSVFMQGIAGIGTSVDVGVVAAALNTSLEVCGTTCTTARDTGSDLGVFGTVFLDKQQNFSIGLSYDSISYQNAANQSIVGLSFVAVLARHHRLALSTHQTRNAGGEAVSSGYGLGYSYLVF